MAVHELHRHRSLADGGGASLRRAGTRVARGVDPGHAGLQQILRTDGRAGEDEAVVVARDRRVQPLRARPCSEEEEQEGQRDVCSGLERDRVEVTGIPMQRRDLAPVLHGDAWLVTEALASSIRKLMKTQRVLASEWEDMPREVFVASTPNSLPAQLYDVGYLARLRTRPDPLIRARRGPAPKLAPWIAGVIVERLIAKQRGEGYQLTFEEQECVVEFVSALCDRDIDAQEYAVRRRRLLRVQELNSLVERFKSSHDQFVSWDAQTASQDRPGWFRVVRTRLKKFGPRETFPYDLQIVSKLIEAYGTSPPRDRGPIPKSPRSRRLRSR